MTLGSNGLEVKTDCGIWKKFPGSFIMHPKS